MKKRLFLTGDQGCGKSTLIRTVLGNRLEAAGGFLTVHTGSAVEIRSLAGQFSPVPFLQFSAADPVFSPEILLQAMHQALTPPMTFAVLDEIGGVELTEPAFFDILNRFFDTGIPCIGVMKNPSSAEKLCRRMGLGADYLQAAADLRLQLEQDSDTLLIQTGDAAREAVRLWAQKYAGTPFLPF